MASYVGGGQSAGELSIELLLTSGSATDLVERQAYVSSAAGQEQATVDMLGAAQSQRRAHKARLDLAQQSATVLLADVAAQRKAASVAASERKATLDRVQGELATLVEAEQARRAAEEAKKAQADWLTAPLGKRRPGWRRRRPARRCGWHRSSGATSSG